MPTKISSFPTDIRNEYYCMESPFRVLRELGPKYHITQFKTVSLIDGAISIGNPGLIIEESKRDLENGSIISGKIKNYKCRLEEGNSFFGKKDMISKLIGTYIVNTKIISYGSENEKIELGKQKAVNYIKERKMIFNPIKEKALEDILEYGKVIFKKRFRIKDVNKIAEEIISKIPEEFSPNSGNYANLRH
jgi:hypothetical protein